MIGVCCTSFFLSFLFLFCFVLFCHTSLHKAQTMCAGGAWSNLDYLSNFFLGDLFLKEFTSCVS